VRRAGFIFNMDLHIMGFKFDHGYGLSGTYRTFDLNSS